MRPELPTSILVSVVSLSLALFIEPDPSDVKPSLELALENLPTTDQAQAASFEHGPALADLFWLESVQRLGRGLGDVSTADARSVVRTSQLATRFDPRYFTPAYVGAVIATHFAKQPERAIEMARRAEKELPTRWEFPFLVGYNLYFQIGNAQAAADAWLEASRRPDSPPFLVSLAGRARAQGGSREEAIALLESLIPSLTDERQRTAAEERLILLRSEARLERYDEACQAYYREYGAWPDSPGQLRIMGLVQAPPEDLSGSAMYFDTEDGRCVTRTEVISVRDFEAKARIGSGKTDGAPVQAN